MQVIVTENISRTLHKDQMLRAKFYIFRDIFLYNAIKASGKLTEVRLLPFKILRSLNFRVCDSYYVTHAIQGTIIVVSVSISVSDAYCELIISSEVW